MFAQSAWAKQDKRSSYSLLLLDTWRYHFHPTVRRLSFYTHIA